MVFSFDSFVGKYVLNWKWELQTFFVASNAGFPRWKVLEMDGEWILDRVWRSRGTVVGRIHLGCESFLFCWIKSLSGTINLNDDWCLWAERQKQKSWGGCKEIVCQIAGSLKSNFLLLPEVFFGSWSTLVRQQNRGAFYYSYSFFFKEAFYGLLSCFFDQNQFYPRKFLIQKMFSSED